MNVEIIGLWLQQTEHIRDHMLHRYFVIVTQIMVATVKLSNKRENQRGNQECTI